MKTPILSLALLAAVALVPFPRGLAQLVVSHWDFNSVPPDAKTTTGSALPTLGTGIVAGIGGATSSFSDATGSGDAAKKDNTGLNLATFSAQGTGSGNRGLQFQVPTVGYQNISVTWDQRFSSTASKAYQFQYTLDGNSYVAFKTFSNAAGGNAWVNGNSVDLSSLGGVSDNPNFGFRVVSVFGPGTSSYAASGVGSNYGTSGTWRFDNVSVLGDATPAVVPEPSEYALFAAGMLGGFAVWRRRRARRA